MVSIPSCFLRRRTGSSIAGVPCTLSLFFRHRVVADAASACGCRTQRASPTIPTAEVKQLRTYVPTIEVKRVRTDVPRNVLIRRMVGGSRNCGHRASGAEHEQRDTNCKMLRDNLLCFCLSYCSYSLQTTTIFTPKRLLVARNDLCFLNHCSSSNLALFACAAIAAHSTWGWRGVDTN
jgi:hypothetical protein